METENKPKPLEKSDIRKEEEHCFTFCFTEDIQAALAHFEGKINNAIANADEAIQYCHSDERAKTQLETLEEVVNLLHRSFPAIYGKRPPVSEVGSCSKCGLDTGCNCIDEKKVV